MKNKKIILKNLLTVKRSQSKPDERPLTDLEKELEAAIRADSLLKEKEYKTVIKEFKKYFKEEARLPILYWQITTAYNSINDFYQSIDLLHDAEDNFPSIHEFWYLLGDAYAGIGSPSLAVSYYKKAIDKETSSNQQLIEFYSDRMAEQKRLIKSRDYFKYSVLQTKIPPPNTLERELENVIYIKSLLHNKEYNKVIRNVHKYNDVSDYLPILIWYQSIAYIETGKLRSAEITLDYAMMMFPEFHEYYYLLGDCYAAKKKPEASNENYRKGLIYENISNRKLISYYEKKVRKQERLFKDIIKTRSCPPMSVHTAESPRSLGIPSWVKTYLTTL